MVAPAHATPEGDATNEPTPAQANAATIAAIPAEYIDERDRAVYVARALAGEDCYAYANAVRWVIWDGAITDGDRRVAYGQRTGEACTCCGELACCCDAWRCAHCGRCLVTGHCRCAREGGDE